MNAIDVPAAHYRVACELARDGADNATIARRVHLAQSSVATYMHSLLEVTGAPTRTALAVGLLRGRISLAPVDDRRRA